MQTESQTAGATASVLLDVRRTQETTKDIGIDDKSSHPELCSEVAGGVTRNIVCLFREPDAGNPPVRFDEREEETELSQTGLRRRGESPDHRHREATVTAPLLDSTHSPGINE